MQLSVSSTATKIEGPAQLSSSDHDRGRALNRSSPARRRYNEYMTIMATHPRYTPLTYIHSNQVNKEVNYDADSKEVDIIIG
jgi:hypothetical protein